MIRDKIVVSNLIIITTYGTNIKTIQWEDDKVQKSQTIAIKQELQRKKSLQFGEKCRLRLNKRVKMFQ